VAPRKPNFHPPQQKRSRESLERVLEAGLEVLAEGGYEAFTIAEVSKRAGVSVGSVYGRFPSKDDLFLAVHREFVARISSERGLTDDQAAKLDTAALIRRAIADIVATFQRRGELLRVFMLRSAIDDGVHHQAHESISRQFRRFRGLLMTRAGEFSHSDPDLAIDVAFRMVWATVSRRVTHGPSFETSRALSWKRMREELGDACVAYLLCAPRR
jgi:AcrR family transcriptional regulator